MATRKTFHVFVYGTLKRREPNHHVIDPSLHTNADTTGVSEFIGSARTEKKFPLVIGTRFNIPFLLDSEGVGHQIRGEIYRVDEKVLKKLDVLEDYPSFYDREIQNITPLDDESSRIPCWIYLIRKFPDRMLSQPLLEDYRNTQEKNYMESYEDEASINDLFDEKL